MGRGLAIALESAGIAVDEGRSREVSVVWTGPAAGVPVLRLTRAVVEEVIGAAEERLLVISFAAYRVPVVVDALVAATDHGVQLDLVLETAADSSGMLAFDSLGELRISSPTRFDERHGDRRGDYSSGRLPTVTPISPPTNTATRAQKT